MPDAKAVCPVSQLLPDRTTPELRHLQVTLGARLPYRQAAELLREFLPEGDGFDHVTTRNRTLAVGKAIDAELCREITEAPPAPPVADRLAIGIDGGFVKAKRTIGRTHLEVLLGASSPVGSARGTAGRLRRVNRRSSNPTSDGMLNELWPTMAS